MTTSIERRNGGGGGFGSFASFLARFALAFASFASRFAFFVLPTLAIGAAPSLPRTPVGGLVNPTLFGPNFFFLAIARNSERSLPATTHDVGFSGGDVPFLGDDLCATLPDLTQPRLSGKKRHFHTSHLTHNLFSASPIRRRLANA